MDYSKELHKVSLRKACKIFSLRSSVFYYRKVYKNSDDEIRRELVLLADSTQTWGFWMMHNRLKNLGFGWKSKIRRSQSQKGLPIYKSMKLNFRNKRKKTASSTYKTAIGSPNLS